MRCYTMLFSLLTFTSLYLSASQIEETTESCEASPESSRISSRHIEGKGIGYNQGYTSIDFFTAPIQFENSLIPFLDARVHIFNNGLPAFNAGLGLRYLSSSWVYGINSYYDYRKTNHFHYNQASLGFEALSKSWDVRVNGYLPVGKKKSSFFDTKFSDFEGHYANLKSKQEFAMKGINLEGGYHFKEMKHASFYAAAGPYYFYNKGKNAIGGEARVSTTIYKYIKFEVNGSYDPIFHGIAQGQVSLIFPFGSKSSFAKKGSSSCANQRVLLDRAFQPVDRSEIIVVDDHHKITKAINPDTGNPYTFYFVDNTSHSLGTSESPYTTLAQAEIASSIGDIIYVYPGSESYHVGEGVHLKDDQKLWGAGTYQRLSTTRGVIGIKKQAHAMPLLVDGLPDLGIVQLANNNEVSGIHITGNGTAGYGILGGDGADTLSFPTSIINSASIQNNLLDGSYAKSAIRLVGKGFAVFAENKVDAEVGEEYSGIEIISTGSDVLNVSIYSGEISVSASHSVCGIGLTSNDLSTLMSDISSVTVQATANGNYYVDSFYAYSMDSSNLTSVISDSTFSGYVSVDAIYGALAADISSFGSSQLNSTIVSSTLIAQADQWASYGMKLQSGGTSQLTSDLISSTVSVTGSDGAYSYGVLGYIDEFAVETFLTSTITSSNISVTGMGTQGTFGVYFESYGPAQVISNVDSSTVTAISEYGSAYSTSGYSTIGDIATNVSLSTLSVFNLSGYNEAVGFFLETAGNAHGTANIISNTVSSNSSGVYGSWGIYFESGGASEIAINVASNDVTVVGNGGVDAYSSGIAAYESGSVITGFIKDNTGTVSGTATNKFAIYAPSVTQENNTIIIE